MYKIAKNTGCSLRRLVNLYLTAYFISVVLNGAKASDSSESKDNSQIITLCKLYYM
ncbi:hypothetical protein J1C67_06680 [Clostridium gasigenes]|uniref:hypothetical protein n=1 Tax=Clostridium gasigenes TaxID=94869 RepID=UPI0014382704|nr:hypothetical protein [Clostridium gasigenes]NKF08314.1 hypothetical protein [Clostridium gasigenes]QSW20817.1 hypothetical protein J1C67_06680 [Clostridium gasigenes]